MMLIDKSIHKNMILVDVSDPVLVTWIKEINKIKIENVIKLRSSFGIKLEQTNFGTKRQYN